MNIKNATPSYYSFGSANPQIRRANDMVRKINTSLPAVSQSRVSEFKHIDKFSFLRIKLNEKMRHTRNLKQSYFSQAQDSYEQACAFIKPVMEKRMANCSECAQIAAISAQMNGIKDFELVKLNTIFGKDLDHTLLLVKNGKKPYIIDPWLGLADCVPKALEKYSGEYKYLFSDKLTARDLVFSPIKNSYSSFLKKPLPNDVIERLKSTFPKLLVK